MRDKRSQQGFSLLEVLVTLVVFSLGILGMAGLMSIALKNTQLALLRSQAAQAAYDLIDRIRANAANADSYALSLGQEADTLTAGSHAGNDLKEWLYRIERTLPSGDAAVEVAGQTIRVHLYWSEQAFGETGDPLAQPKYSLEAGL